MSEKYVSVILDIYEGSRAIVKCAVGLTKWLNVKFGLYQGSALSPFLFVIVIH